MPEVSSEQYRQSFEKFLAHTDEKAIFVKELGSYLERYNPESVLDIGAGNGSLAIPISESIENYEAVEQNPKYAQKLRDAGIKTLEATFPTPLAKKFGLVMLSHVVSYEAANHTELIPPALSAVEPNGHLLLVTHRGNSEDDWSRLLKSISINKFSGYATIYSEIIDMLSKAGKTEVRKVSTTLDTDNLEDMLEAMAFVAANGRTEDYKEFIAQRDKIKEILDSKYATAKGYSFPFQHIFIATHCSSV
jgi:SAM-dependent methyltransferase